ncbi:MAG: hypothetical protein ABSG31_18340, partial [Tepidisphaeraceae bacterium]
RMATDKCAEIWFLSVSIRAIHGCSDFSSLGICLGALGDSAVAFERMSEKLVEKTRNATISTKALSDS